MKGLMETSSAVAGVKINARAARKHYGTESSKQFREQLHDIARRYGLLCLHRERNEVLTTISIDIGTAVRANTGSIQSTGSSRRSSTPLLLFL